jgi:hypothetical protein
MVQLRAFCQPAVNAGCLGFFRNPLLQPRPDTHQAFVRNVYHRLLGRRNSSV